MSWTDILTDEEVAEIAALLDSDEGSVEVEAPLFEDVDAWAFAEQD